MAVLEHQILSWRKSFRIKIKNVQKKCILKLKKISNAWKNPKALNSPRLSHGLPEALDALEA